VAVLHSDVIRTSAYTTFAAAADHNDDDDVIAHHSEHLMLISLDT